MQFSICFRSAIPELILLFDNKISYYVALNRGNLLSGAGAGKPANPTLLSG